MYIILCIHLLEFKRYFVVLSTQEWYRPSNWVFIGLINLVNQDKVYLYVLPINQLFNKIKVHLSMIYHGIKGREWHLNWCMQILRHIDATWQINASCLKYEVNIVYLLHSILSILQAGHSTVFILIAAHAPISAHPSFL